MQKNKLILGTVQLGLEYGVNNSSGKPSLTESFEILHEAYDRGVRFLDTAEGYGESQNIIGDFHRKFPDKTFNVLTKFKGSSSGSAVESFKRSAETLAVKEIYSFSFHQFSDVHSDLLVSEIISLRTEGHIKKIGVSVYTNEELEVAIDLDFVDVIQLPFNLLDNFSKRGALLTKAKKLKKEIHVRSVFLQGLFFKDLSSFQDSVKGLTEYVSELRKLSRSYNVSINTLALRYATDCPFVDGVLVGVERVSQLIENFNVLEYTFDKKIYEEIDTISAPESMLDPRNW